MTDDRFRLVFVCTGNRFRSPLAAALAAKLLAGHPVAVESFGTLDLDTGALPEAAAAAQRLGLDLGSHRTRGLAAKGLAEADLVIGFETDHVRAAVGRGGAHASRTFTLPEIATLAARANAPATGDVARARGVVEAAHRLRAGRGDEIPDPLGQSRAFQGLVVDRVVELTERLASTLFPRA